VSGYTNKLTKQTPQY